MLSFPYSATQLHKCGTDLLPGVPSFFVLAFLKGLANVWEAAVSPFGGLQSTAHLWWCTACWIENQLGKLSPGSSKLLMPSSRSLSRLLNPSPQEPVSHRRPSPKKRKSDGCEILESISCSSEICFKIYFQTISKTNSKIEDFGLPKPSQNRAKMPSKPMSQKKCDFSSSFA